MVCGLRNCERDGVPADDGEKVVVPPAIAPVVAQDKIIISESRLYNKQLMISSRPEAKASRGLRARRSRQGAPLPAPPYTLKRPHRHSERLPKAKTCANAFHLLKSRRTRRSSFFGRYSAPVAGTPSWDRPWSSAFRWGAWMAAISNPVARRPIVRCGKKPSF